MVDRELVLRKAAALEGYLGELEQFRNVDVETYRADWTFFQPSGDVVIVGTTGGVSMRSWRVRQAISLATLLPDKYPGQTIVFSAIVLSIEPNVAIAFGHRRSVTVSTSYNRTLSYVESRQFVRHAVTLTAGASF